MWPEPIPFERFMDFCLYDPQQGYYRRGGRVIGKAGDFFTSPHTHPLFARTLARVVNAADAAMSSPGGFDLVELGAGEGRLGRDLRRWIAQTKPDLHSRLRYRPVELGCPNLPRRIEGVVLANEFFDALPVHRVRVDNSRLREIYVRHDGSEWIEEDGEPSDPGIPDFLRRGFGPLREGYCYEVNLRMVSAFRDLSSRMLKGLLITLDYGYDREEYDALPRPGGTLLCYHRHQVNQEFYRRIGRQDMTAHVNFEVMRSVGRELGWQDQPLVTQREFLMNWGLGDLLLEAEGDGVSASAREIEERLQLKSLLQPGGISDHLKVLVQTVGMNAPTRASTGSLDPSRQAT